MKLNIFIHFEEFKIRFVYILISSIFTFCSCFYFKTELFFILSWFFLNLENKFIYTNLFDPLLLYIKVSILFTIIFTLPCNIYFLFFSFYITSFYLLSFSTLLFSYFHLLPFIIKFLLKFQRIELFNPLKLILQATISKYFAFIYVFLILFLLIFFVCNLLLLSMVFFLRTAIYYRKFLYLLLIVFLVIFAPPDLFLQVIILPFFVIFIEIIIYYTTFWHNIYILYQKNDF